MQLHLIPSAQSVQEQEPNAAMSVAAFLHSFPQYEFNFGKLMVDQKRVYDGAALLALPVELSPSWPYRRKGRGRHNFNDTRAHSQCGHCRRVLRNDMYCQPPSAVRQNLIHPFCKDCQKVANAKRYAENSDTLTARRRAIWEYLASRCEICGYDEHVVAIDMHHLGDKEHTVSRLLTEFAAGLNVAKGRKLLDEAEKCVAVCSNCHRLLHVGIVELPVEVVPRRYDLGELMQVVGADNVAENTKLSAVMMPFARQ